MEGVVSYGEQVASKCKMNVFLSSAVLTIGLFAGSAWAGSIPSNLFGTAPAKQSDGGLGSRAKRSLNPLKGIRKLHEGFVNLAINISSIGIDQPAVRLDDPRSTADARPQQASSPVK